MSNSLRHPHPSCKDQKQRACDYCGDSTALLYCRADSAKLCFSCDREVHSTNQLFSKHTRTLLCDACDASPATILCSTENTVICQNCDWETHNLALSSVHERRPLEGFTGCPSVTELLTIVGFEDLGKKALLLTHESDGRGCGGGDGTATCDGFLGFELEGFSDLLVWDAPAVVSLDDLIASSVSPHNYQAMEVPPLPKNRKAACGRHKEEIFSQLRELAKLEPNLNDEDVDLDPDTERLSNMQQLVPEQNVFSRDLATGFECDIEAGICPTFEAGDFRWHNHSSESAHEVVPPSTALNSEEIFVIDNHSISAVHNGGQPKSFNCKSLSATPKVSPYELTSQERDSAILRYKEKKKARRFDKHVRYESRKVRAESRTRIKGRFAKIEH
ncbi:hypothetical protein L6164_010175 [Bauhinia variegata]|uniref:Uncharacterized protein n=1 Tax=Bauhinia variegata TaxID=167791 RepID=A0ACB9PNJ1_BAUVA|nr:hypothetical protein L6164_010175 [Bauhinia variegata]